MLPVADLDYELPESLIARMPIEPRDAARLLVVSRADPSLLLHRHVRDLPEFLRAGDLLVVNDSAVLPARLQGVRADTGGRVEGLFLAEISAAPLAWRVLLKGKRMKPGIDVRLHASDGADAGVSLRLQSRDEGDEEGWRVEVLAAGWKPAAPGEQSTGTAATSAPRTIDLLHTLGTTPIPPYIRAARKRHADDVPDDADRARYQTVYASPDAVGSVAAPTAGLHFTPGLLERLAAKGVARAGVTLHVGTGTFKPVEAEFVEQHPMHAEWCDVPESTRRAVAGTRARGGRVVAVGTTAARTLESCACHPNIVAGFWTRILITPGHIWRDVDALLTNFHLPRSTLMAMVAARLHTPDTHGVTRLNAIYNTAVREGYRFYSYGDAMLILP